jgi:hypothetical protein
MTTTNNQLATQSQAPAPRKASLELASFLGMESNVMLEVIRAQCFKGTASDMQLAAFVSIAADMRVNPMLPGMLYAYPIQGGGIIPMMGPDGMYKKLSEHPDVDSWETTVFPEDATQPPTHAVAKIWRKGREKPLTYTATLTEWKIDSNPNWKTRPRHMLGLRALKQCARQIIHGLPHDEDDRVIMREVAAVEIPRAQISEAAAVDATILPPEKKPEPRTRKSAQAETQPAPETSTTTQQTPAETSLESQLETKLAAEGFTVAHLCAMAVSMDLVKKAETMADIGDKVISEILADWNTAADAMKVIKAKEAK